MVDEQKTLKQEIVNWVDGTSDSELLSVLQSMKESVPKDGSDWWFSLRDTEKKSIEDGWKDLKEGRIISSEVFWSRLSK